MLRGAPERIEDDGVDVGIGRGGSGGTPLLYGRPGVWANSRHGMKIRYNRLRRGRARLLGRRDG